MGIPKFYRDWVRRQNGEYTGILQRSGVPPNVAGLYIDMNGLFHDEAQIVYAYGNGADEARLAQIATMTPAELEVEHFNAIGVKLLRILHAVAPREFIIMAVDGVAPAAKMNQQRQRRARSALERPERQIFDTNSITPGTDMMIRLDHYLKQWIQVNELTLPPRVIYSSHLEPGEGEHKILRLMREGKVTPNGDGAHVIYGLDADLIILGMLAPFNNVYLMRVDVNDVVNIDNLKLSLLDRMGTERALTDFVLITFLIGNDFLPHMPALHDLSYSINVLMDVYVTINQVGDYPLTDDNGIIWSNFSYYLATLAQLEPELISRRALETPTYPMKTIDSATVRTTDENGHVSIDVDFDLFRNAWYYHALAPKTDDTALMEKTAAALGIELYPVDVDSIAAMVDSYLTGLAWVYNYYLGGMEAVNIDYIYRYHYTPLITDLAGLLGQRLEADIPVIGYEPVEGLLPLNPVHQLLAVLPLRSAALLPREVRHFANENSPLGDLYPDSFQIDLDGLNEGYEYMGVVILPFVNIDRIISAVDQITFSAPRAALYKQTNAVIIDRDPDKQRILDEKKLFMNFLRQEGRARRGLTLTNEPTETGLVSTRGGYRGDTRGGTRGGYRGEARGGIRGDTRGGYRGEARGGIRGDTRGGYRGEARGGYRGDTRGGYRGLDRGGARGGIRGEARGGFRADARGGYRGEARGGIRGDVGRGTYIDSRGRGEIQANRDRGQRSTLATSGVGLLPTPQVIPPTETVLLPQPSSPGLLPAPALLPTPGLNYQTVRTPLGPSGRGFGRGR